MNIQSLTDGPLATDTADALRDALRIPTDTRPIAERLRERDKDRASLNRKARRYYDPFPDRDAFAPDPDLGSPILMPGTDLFTPGCGITPPQGGQVDYDGSTDDT
jgi:hypothetical protein